MILGKLSVGNAIEILKYISKHEGYTEISIKYKVQNRTLRLIIKSYLQIKFAYLEKSSLSLDQAVLKNKAIQTQKVLNQANIT